MSAPMPVVPPPRSVPPLLLRNYRCTGCFYGISVGRPPSRCPMCSGRAWRPEQPRR